MILALVAAAGAAAVCWLFSKADPPPLPEGMQEVLLDLDYVPEGFPMGLSTGQGFALHLFETPDASTPIRELPPDTGAARTYDRFGIAGGSFLTVTEATSPPRIHLDANGNTDLTDDPGPFPGERPGAVVPNFYALELPDPEGGEPFPYRLWIFPSPQGGTRFYAGCHMAGELRLGGEAYVLVLFDANANGTYADDGVAIDADGDGTAQDGECLPPGGRMDLGGRTILLRGVSASGRQLRLAF